MIIGPNSIKKFGILFILVLAGVADFIATMNNVVVAKVNGAVVSVLFVLAAVLLYIKWSKESEALYENAVEPSKKEEPEKKVEPEKAAPVKKTTETKPVAGKKEKTIEKKKEEQSKK